MLTLTSTLPRLATPDEEARALTTLPTILLGDITPSGPITIRITKDINGGLTLATIPHEALGRAERHSNVSSATSRARAILAALAADTFPSPLPEAA